MFRMILCLSLLIPAMPVQARAAAPIPQICEICGHECCCPEMCAAKRAAMKTCQQSESACKLGNHDESNCMTETSKAEFRLKPVSEAEFLMNPMNNRREYFVNSDAPKIFSSPTYDVLTPPPRSTAQA